MNRIFSLVLLASLVLAASPLPVWGVPTASAPIFPASQTEKKPFSFGPGTGRSHSHYRTLYVPPGTSIGVAVDIKTDGNVNVPVVIEVRQASATSLDNTGPDGPILDSLPAVAPRLVTFTRNFTSNFGCPNTWRVRVMTQSGQPPPVKVEGDIIFVFTVPAASKLARWTRFNLVPGEFGSEISAP